MSSRRMKSTNMPLESEKILTALPVRETSWVKMTNLKGEKFVITSPKERTIYLLYQVMDNDFKKITKSVNPKELDMIVYPDQVSQ